MQHVEIPAHHGELAVLSLLSNPNQTRRERHPFFALASLVEVGHRRVDCPVQDAKILPGESDPDPVLIGQ